MPVLNVANVRARWLAAPMLGLLVTTPTVWAHPPVVPPTRVDPALEARLHTPPGFSAEGKPQAADVDASALLRVKIVDRDTGQPAFCRVNVVGSDGNYYEPQDSQLAPWSLHRAGNRLGKGPFRYYGWFFFTPGTFEVRVPAGATRVEVWKGYEFRPLSRTVSVVVGATQPLQLELQRVAAVSDVGYYSGDTHIHLPRLNATDDARALDLMAAEDIQFGFFLSANDGKGYSGNMDRQVIARQRSLGPDSVARRGLYEIASGQEMVTRSYGHLGLLLHRRIVLAGLTVDINRWPLLGLIGQETRELGGYSFNLHGGYAGEIYIDFAQRATDGVELLQFADYRGIALEGWYRILNIGYRFAALGASDYPYCRALGDCRTYVYHPTRPDPAQWIRGAVAGRSFFTTGPLVLLEVDGARPGDVIERQGSGTQLLRARVRLRSEVAPVTHVELVVNGRSVGRRELAPAEQGTWFELEHELKIDGPAWIAARAWSASLPGQPDAEAHTNPVLVTIDRKLPYREADLDWLVEKVDGQIAGLRSREFEEKPAALEFFNASRRALLEIRKAGGQKISASK
jgi:hypothetical protein